MTTPATAASWGGQLHRRVQLHRHHFYGNVFERSAQARSEFCRTAPRGRRRRLPAGKAEGTWAVGAVFFAYFLAAESRSAGGPRPAFCKQRRHVAKTIISVKSEPSPDTAIASSYQKSACFVARDRGRESPRQASYLSCSHKKRNPKNAPRLSASLRYVSLRSGKTCVTQFSLRCRPTRFALTAHRSNKRRQVRARSNAVLRQRCPQPEQRAAGAARREESDGLLDL